MRGKIEGDRLVFESVPDAPVRIRLVWDLTDPNVLIWRNEVSIDGSPWALVEQYDCRPMEPGEKT